MSFLFSGRAARAALALAPAAFALTVGYSATSFAYSTDSVLSDPCHERITLGALEALRQDLPDRTVPPQASRGEKAMIDDLPFDVPPRMRDVAAATLVLANRDVDIRGHESDELDNLATVHADPARQREHCLRSPSQDEPEGSRLALEDCRGFIMQSVESAVLGLGPDGMVDSRLRIPIEIVLELRGAVDVGLPRFWVEMGRALHALQDGFSHTYRDPADQTRVITVMNYLEFIEETLNEHRDGPPHSSGLDRCEDIDGFRRERLGLAVTASYDLMRAVLDPADTNQERLARSDMVLSRYLTLDESGTCTAANEWCNAPERQYEEERGCVCRAAGTPTGRSHLPFAAALAVAAAAFSRRAKRRTAHIAGGLLAGLGLLAAPRAAQAQFDDATPEPTPPAVPVEADARVRVVDATPDGREKDPFPFGVEIAGGGSFLENAAVAANLGLRYRLSSRFLIGVDGEFNPWFATRDRDLRSGTTNVFATGILRFPLSFQRVNLRSTLEAGISRMNMDLVGVPEGSVGPYFGVNLLGIDYELARSFYLIVDPAHVAVPIPQTEGVPFAYPQYRFTLGLQIGA